MLLLLLQRNRAYSRVAANRFIGVFCLFFSWPASMLPRDCWSAERGQLDTVMAQQLQVRKRVGLPRSGMCAANTLSIPSAPASH